MLTLYILALGDTDDRDLLPKSGNVTKLTIVACVANQARIESPLLT